MRRGDVGPFAPVEQNVLAGRALLWIVTDGERIAAAAITELQRTEQQSLCLIVACGGVGMRRWLHLIDGIEQYAAAEGCAAVRIVGRKGWLRALPRYRAKRVILEKELA
jgi:hypothetical protein